MQKQVLTPLFSKRKKNQTAFNPPSAPGDFSLCACAQCPFLRVPKYLGYYKNSYSWCGNTRNFVHIFSIFFQSAWSPFWHFYRPRSIFHISVPWKFTNLRPTYSHGSIFYQHKFINYNFGFYKHSLKREIHFHAVASIWYFTKWTELRKPNLL